MTKIISQLFICGLVKFLYASELCFLIYMLWQDLILLCTKAKIRLFEKRETYHYYYSITVFVSVSDNSNRANKTRLGGPYSTVNVGASLPSAGQQRCHSGYREKRGGSLRKEPWETEAHRGEGTCWRARS